MYALWWHLRYHWRHRNANTDAILVTIIVSKLTPSRYFAWLTMHKSLTSADRKEINARKSTIDFSIDCSIPGGMRHFCKTKSIFRYWSCLSGAFKNYNHKRSSWLMLLMIARSSTIRTCRFEYNILHEKVESVTNREGACKLAIKLFANFNLQHSCLGKVTKDTQSILKSQVWLVELKTFDFGRRETAKFLSRVSIEDKSWRDGTKVARIALLHQGYLH